MDSRVTEGVDWVGYVDWTVRDFHGYNTPRGATYNAYLIRDEKTALIDTVKAPFAEDLLKNVSALADLSAVDYVVCNHAETDHAGALPRVMEALPNATLVCNKKCVAALSRHFDISGWKTQVVETGDSIPLGKRTLDFINTPMLHWPESMFTYIPEDKLLFSMDAFGQHYATSRHFDDQVSAQVALDEAKAYYANIVMPYGKQAAGALKRAGELDVQMIAPSHGVIWRSHLAEIRDAYRNWSAQRPLPKVLVIYDTMWDSTGRMARAIHEGACDGDVDALLMPIRGWDLTRIATEVLDTAAVAFGSSTLNREMMPMASAVLTYLKGLRPVGKASFAFGSYGWGKGGPEAVHECLTAMKWEITRDPLKSQFRPTPEILNECRAAGATLAQRAKEIAAASNSNVDR
jgi:flavorubredoxin